MLLAQADFLQGKYDDAVKEAERSIDLGHERAASVRPLLAHALFERGEPKRPSRFCRIICKLIRPTRMPPN